MSGARGRVALRPRRLPGGAGARQEDRQGGRSPGAGPDHDPGGQETRQGVRQVPGQARAGPRAQERHRRREGRRPAGLAERPAPGAAAWSQAATTRPASQATARRTAAHTSPAAAHRRSAQASAGRACRSSSVPSRPSGPDERAVGTGGHGTGTPAGGSGRSPRTSPRKGVPHGSSRSPAWKATDAESSGSSARHGRPGEPQQGQGAGQPEDEEVRARAREEREERAERIGLGLCHSPLLALLGLALLLGGLDRRGGRDLDLARLRGPGQLDELRAEGLDRRGRAADRDHPRAVGPSRTSTGRPPLVRGRSSAPGSAAPVKVPRSSTRVVGTPSTFSSSVFAAPAASGAPAASSNPGPSGPHVGLEGPPGHPRGRDPQGGPGPRPSRPRPWPRPSARPRRPRRPSSRPGR